jgi:hypothetical protein
VAPAEQIKGRVWWIGDSMYLEQWVCAWYVRSLRGGVTYEAIYSVPLWHCDEETGFPDPRHPPNAHVGFLLLLGEEVTLTC